MMIVKQWVYDAAAIFVTGFIFACGALVPVAAFLWMVTP